MKYTTVMNNDQMKKEQDYYYTPSSEKQRPLPIKPPRSIKRSLLFQIDKMNISPTYSLFNSVSPSLDWLNHTPENGTIMRKHSISADGSDSLFSSTTTKYDNNYAGFWRRASLPNQHFMASTCAICTLPTTNIKSCNHSICQDCTIISSCPLCLKEKHTLSPSGSVASSLIASSDFFNEQQPSFSSFGIPVNNNNSSNLSPPPSDSLIYPEEEEDEAFYIGDLLSPSESFSSIKPIFYCIKLANIPWDVSLKDVKSFFKDFQIPSVQAQSIHIMMDRMTGKTLSDCYVEFISKNEAFRAIEYGNQRMLKSRLITITPCSTEELLGVIFPKWQSGFTGNRANYPSLSSTTFSLFVTRDEINSLLVICKNYKLHFSRKCAERPFENIITIITKYPWEQSDLVTALQRDHIFEMVKLSIESLKVHLSKEVVHIDNTLLERMLRAGMMCPAFTERQKTTLLHTADNMKCPSMYIESCMNESQQRQGFTCKPMSYEDYNLENSYIHVPIIQQHNNTTCVSSLLNILNAPQTQEEGKSLTPTRIDDSKENKFSSSGSESDEESYCFCEDDEDSFYKLQI